MSFASLGLSAPILESVSKQGYSKPSAIQQEAIPAVLAGKDIMAAAQTGTGKTAGFSLPILERLSKGQRASANQVRTLILTPTRELAAQVGDSVKTYGENVPLSSAIVFGGVKINPQMMRLRRGADILVATPGRLLDLYNQNAVRFKQLEILVLDEADRMLDMGFIHDIRKILALLPQQRQTLLFSATFSAPIRQLAKGLLHQPVEISVNPPNSTAKSVEQWIYPVDKKQKPALLTHLIQDNQWQQVLVFTKTKHGANRLSRHLENAGIKAAAIHGNKSQGARTRALAEFKEGKTQILVATDIAARGLDIDQLPQVVNFDLPNVAEDYVHRIGRTGRAGAVGQAVSLVCADEFKQLSDIERLIQKLLERKLIDGFEPIHNLPESRLNTRPMRPKKPKKPKLGHRDGQRSGEIASGHQPTSKGKKRRPQNKRGQASSAKPGGKSPGNSRTQRAKASSKPATTGNSSNRNRSQRNSKGRSVNPK